jgi:tRNA-(ms[2]io[6]A)-hydroxylase
MEDTILEFLLCETPDSWVEAAVAQPKLLLIDHANCEKKAASTALNLMYRYVDDYVLLNKMSRLAREELRHFEQVIAIMKRRGIVYEQLTASRYAADLRKAVRGSEPGKLIDTLIVGAIIEARSCERFAKLAPHVDEELRKFYESLLKSEERHYRDYLALARKAAGGESFTERTRFFLEKDKALVLERDDEFRFHSGPASIPKQLH